MNVKRKQSGIVLRSGKTLTTREEKYRMEFFDHFLGYHDGDDYDDIDYSIGLADPTLYERVRTKKLGSEDDSEEEYHHFSEEQKYLMEEQKDLERRFDFAEIRNELRGYVVDSFLYGRIDEDQLNNIAENFNKSVDIIKRKGLSVTGYEKICKKKFRRVLSIVLCSKVVSFEQFDDITQRERKMRGRNNNTFRRNKEEYFGDSFSCSDVGTDVESLDSFGSESCTETTDEETTCEPDSEIETIETTETTETSEVTETTVTTVVTTSY